MSPVWTAQRIADLVSGRCEGAGDGLIERVADVSVATSTELAFWMHSAGNDVLAACRAGALLVAEEVRVPAQVVAIRVSSPRRAFAIAAAALHPPIRCQPGCHPTAVVAEDASVEGAELGPFVVVESGARMGRGARVGAHALIGRDVIVGEDTQIMPHAVLMAGVQVGARCRIFPGAVVGAPGFGHVPTDGLPLRVPQLSNVVIGDDVDVGANSCVDRGALTPTRIGTGCRLDNLVQVAHSAEIAESVMMAAFVGVAGSAQVGAHSRLGARSAVVDGVAVGRDVDLAAATSVTRSVSDGSQMGGTPARPLPLWRREQAALRSLPDLIRQVDHLERQVRQLKGEQP